MWWKGHLIQPRESRNVAARNETAEKNVIMPKCLLIEGKERNRHENAELWPQQVHHNGRKPREWKRLWQLRLNQETSKVERKLSVVCLSRASARWRDGRYDRSTTLTHWLNCPNNWIDSLFSFVKSPTAVELYGLNWPKGCVTYWKLVPLSCHLY